MHARSDASMHAPAHMGILTIQRLIHTTVNHHYPQQRMKTHPTRTLGRVKRCRVSVGVSLTTLKTRSKLAPLSGCPFHSITWSPDVTQPQYIRRQYTHTHTHTHTHTYSDAHGHIHRRARTHAHTHIAHARTHTHTHTHTLTHTHTHTHTHTQMHTDTYTGARAHTHTLI